MKSQSKHQNFLLLCSLLKVSSGLAIANGLVTGGAIAQSISIDGSTPTQLNGTNSCSGNCTITGGLRDSNGSGVNLFHSFDYFNIDTGSTVTFDDPGVTNIFSRITGAGNLSTIDGTLAVDGAANLFLLNANGIMFGENASLDLQGSFLSSTADSILFQDKTPFSATNPAEVPSLLTVSTPIGLQFGSAPNPIEIEGSGHTLAYGPAITRNAFGPPASSLQVSAGKNLAFIGGAIRLRGGNLIAEGGHIEVGSIGEGERVMFDSEASQWQFDYDQVSAFQDISLTQSALVDVSSSDAGSVQIQGQQISLGSGSSVLAQVTGSGSGHITVNASEKLQLTGENIFMPPDVFTMPTSIYLEIAPFGTGDGTSLLSVNAPEIGLTGGAQIGLTMAGSGSAGSVRVRSQLANLNGVSNAGPSAIFTTVAPLEFTPTTASGGDLDIRIQQLNVTDGGTVGANTFGPGSGGNLAIVAEEITVDGAGPSSPSILGTASEVSPTNPFLSLPKGSGNSGSALIETHRLSVTNGGQVATTIASNNAAGNLTIRATESITLDGRTDAGRSGLLANAFEGSGSGGDIIVTTDVLSVLNEATINASNFPSSESGGRPPGSGSAGNIRLSAQTLEVKDGGVITANTVAGDRANIMIQTDSLVLRRGSTVTTNASGSATGGDINIDAEAIVAFENSDITANAVDDFGGRIVIDANVILGTTYRESLTPQSDITATSDLGPAFSGSVEINNPEVDPTEGITELPEGLSTENQIANACEETDSNTFVATGRGGLPESSNLTLANQSLWNDFRLLESIETLPTAQNDTAPSIANEPSTNTVSPDALPNIVEAQMWATNHKGQLVLGVYSETFVSSHTLPKCLAQQASMKLIS